MGFGKKFSVVIILLILCVSCYQQKAVHETESRKKELPKIIEVKKIVPPKIDSIKIDSVAPSIGELEQVLIDSGLVNIQKIDSSILVELKYSTTDNFVHIDLYGDLDKCYLQKDVALKLSNAQKLLKERYPELTLLVYDGVRPKRIQKLLWDTVDVPEKIRHYYVANPEEGSLHNYGAAVDLTLADSIGKPLDMGTSYDFFGSLAYPIKEAQYLKEGKLTADQVNNRLILRNVMIDAGFTSITTEWWHFNSCSKIRASKIYRIVE